MADIFGTVISDHLIGKLKSDEGPSYYLGGGDNDFALLADFNPAEDVVAIRDFNATNISNLELDGRGAGVGIFENGDLIGFAPG